jgi:hypothetical protein
LDRELRTLVRARSIALCDEPLAPVGPDVMCFDVPTTASVQRARLEAVFDSTRTLDGWTCQLLDTATHVAALILEIERCQGRRAGSRARPDGAAPLIGSSQAIRAVRERIERVAATDFTVLIEGGSGPQPHPGFIDVYPRAAVSWGDGKVAGAGEYAPEALNRRAERRSSPRNAAAV